MTALLARHRSRRQARRERRVLAVLLLHETLRLAPPSGWPIAHATGHSSGAVYVALARLERDGLVESDWQPLPPDKPKGTPRRRLYRLTDAGRAHAEQVVARWLRGEGR